MEKEGEDAALWQLLNVWGMSDLESDEEGSNKIHRTLTWRGAEFTDVVRRSDIALGKVRLYGQPSNRVPNEHCVNFIRGEISEESESEQSEVVESEDEDIPLNGHE